MAESLSKAKLALYRKFLMKKTREQEGRFLLEGWHLLDEALKAGKRPHALIFDAWAPRDAAEEELLGRAMAVSELVFEGTADQLAQVSDTKTSQGVVALVDCVGLGFDALVATLPRGGALRLLVLDGLGDPGNCGALLRAAAWFGLDGAVLGRGCCELENGKCARSSMGALFHLPVAVGADLSEALARLQALGVSVLTTELQGAVSLEGFSFPERGALVIGSEARGVSEEVSALAEAKLFVPRFGTGESLNAAAAGAVFLSHWRMGGRA